MALKLQKPLMLINFFVFWNLISGTRLMEEGSMHCQESAFQPTGDIRTLCLYIVYLLVLFLEWKVMSGLSRALLILMDLNGLCICEEILI